jgi:hypothetical protein
MEIYEKSSRPRRNYPERIEIIQPKVGAAATTLGHRIKMMNPERVQSVRE